MQGIETHEAEYTAKDLLPSRQSWEDALSPFLQLPPRPSTAITSPTGGTVHLIQRELSESFKALWLTLPRDSARCTAAFRLAVFTIKALSTFDITKQLAKEDLETLFYFLPLAVQLIDDDLSIENCNVITGLELADQREEYLELVFTGRKVIGNWINNKDPLSFMPDTNVSSFLVSFWESKLEGLGGKSPVDYRIGESFVRILASADGAASAKSADDVAKICREARTANGIRSAAWFAALRSSILSNPVGNRICNELVADSTGLKPQDSSDGMCRGRPSNVDVLIAHRAAKACSLEHPALRGRGRRLDHPYAAIGLPGQKSH